MKVSLLFIALTCWASASAAQTPAFDPRGWKGQEAGRATEILTIGSAHLSQIAAATDRSLLEGLLAKLEAFNPTIITAENVSGEQCDQLKRFPSLYPDSFSTWCRSPEVAQRALGMDGATAAAEVRKTLEAWPSHPSAAARRRLAALFLAAGETPSATVQWRRLAPTERRVGDGVTSETLPLLERTDAKPNETYDVAVALAVRLGLERVYLVDDHTSDGALDDTGKVYGDAVQAAWAGSGSDLPQREEAMFKRLQTPADLLDAYRFLNRPEVLREQVSADFNANLRRSSPALYGRQYVSAWEVRNLRMVSNVMAAAAAHPGSRVLNIVGNSHKAYYDAFLNLIPDVSLVDAEDVLR